MCGRFTLRTPATVLIEHFDLDVRGDRQLTLFEPRYNIAPTQEVVVVRADPAGGRRSAAMMRWGLLPSWSKGVASGPPMINARAETLAEKPAFRTAFRCRRCLVPADGFYEWQLSPSGARGKKQPFYIHRPDNAPLAFAGLWDSWSDPSAALTIESCTIVTTAANAALRELHDRMPVVIAGRLCVMARREDRGAGQASASACGVRRPRACRGTGQHARQSRGERRSEVHRGRAFAF